MRREVEPPRRPPGPLWGILRLAVTVLVYLGATSMARQGESGAGLLFLLLFMIALIVELYSG